MYKSCKDNTESPHILLFTQLPFMLTSAITMVYLSTLKVYIVTVLLTKL